MLPLYSGTRKQIFDPVFANGMYTLDCGVKNKETYTTLICVTHGGSWRKNAIKKYSQWCHVITHDNGGYLLCNILLDWASAVIDQYPNDDTRCTYTCTHTCCWPEVMSIHSIYCVPSASWLIVTPDIGSVSGFSKYKTVLNGKVKNWSLTNIFPFCCITWTSIIVY